MWAARILLLFPVHPNLVALFFGWRHPFFVVLRTGFVPVEPYQTAHSAEIGARLPRPLLRFPRVARPSVSRRQPAYVSTRNQGSSLQERFIQHSKYGAKKIAEQINILNGIKYYLMVRDI